MSVGGGSDTWARFHLPFLQRNLPGGPTVVVRNITGGGGINGTNQFAGRARPGRADDPRHHRLDPVSVPARRSARALRLCAMGAGAGLADRRA
jgi:hypothetical protein